MVELQKFDSGFRKIFRLNFEKTVILVLVMILLISSTNIYTQFIDLIFPDKVINTVQPSNIKGISFPAMLLKADRLYKEEKYKEAQSEYLALANMTTLSSQQKSVAYFRLGLCNSKLKLYELARDSFLKSASLNSNDAVAYNNAAVASYYMNDFEKAEELQKKAIAKSPVVEYYYNLARIYETPGRYMDAVKYYKAVDMGEGNITRDDRIDPVRIKNKIMKLTSGINYKEDASNDLMIALKLKDTREVFVIEDADMDIKSDKFKWNVAQVDGVSRLYCSYDREAADPYNLIDSLNWTVKSNGKVIFTSKKSDFSLKLSEKGNYVVSLDITYNGKKHAGGSVSFAGGSVSTAGSNVFEHNRYTNVSDEKCKYYEYAVYEQVFDSNFRIDTDGYTDRFNTQWGKDENVETEIMEKDFMDAQRALYIKNNSDRNAGIWADLTALINDKHLKGKTIGIKFYARKISDNARLDVRLSVKSGKPYKNTYKRYELDYRWKMYGFDVIIPENADGMTISFKTKSGEEVKLDGFIITIVK